MNDMCCPMVTLYRPGFPCIVPHEDGIRSMEICQVLILEIHMEIPRFPPRDGSQWLFAMMAAAQQILVVVLDLWSTYNPTSHTTRHILLLTNHPPVRIRTASTVRHQLTEETRRLNHLVVRLVCQL